MRPIDFILLIPLLYAAYRGFKKGFLIEFINVLAFVLAVIGGLKLLGIGVQYLEPVIGKENNIIPFVAFILIFLSIIIGISFLGRKLKAVLSITILGSIDNLVGAVFGVIKVAFLVSLILWLMEEADVALTSQLTEGAIIYPYFLDYSPKLIEWVTSLLPFAKDLVQSIKEMFA